METTSKRLLAAGQIYNTPVIQNNQLFVPIITANDSFNYLHCIDPDTGVNLLTIALEERFVASGFHRLACSRYGDLFYFWGEISNKVYIVNLRSGTYTTTTLPSGQYQLAQAGFTMISETVGIGFSVNTDGYFTLDLATGTFSSVGYDSTTNLTNFAGATASFFDVDSTGYSNFGDKVFWSSARSTSPTRELSRATLTGITPAARTIVSNGVTNSNRSEAIGLNSSKSILMQSLSVMYELNEATGAAVVKHSAADSTTFGGEVYQRGRAGTTSGGLFCGLPSEDIYAMYFATAGADVKWSLAIIDGTTSAVTEVREDVSPLRSNFTCPNGSILRVNENDHIAHVWNDTTDSASTYYLSKYDGASQIGSDILVTGIDPAHSTIDTICAPATPNFTHGFVYAGSSFTP